MYIPHTQRVLTLTNYSLLKHNEKITCDESYDDNILDPIIGDLVSFTEYTTMPTTKKTIPGDEPDSHLFGTTLAPATETHPCDDPYFKTIIDISTSDSSNKDHGLGNDNSLPFTKDKNLNDMHVDIESDWEPPLNPITDIK